MSRAAVCPTLLLLTALIALSAAQGFYSQRYGKRGDDNREVTVRSGFYANRYGRSSPSQGLPEIKIRSAHFIGGSRYGKRSDNPSQPEYPVAVTSEGDDADVPAPLLLGDSVVCLLVDVPDIYRCVRKPTSEESTN
ncbi:uncharacterized protein [Panulirus ornatus]|uniref:uncharacterized protein n=1 Tax=Panulirus ornatus TaxID=150431 RepID=UPI003A849527